MRHRKLRRNPGHRKALLRNLMNALVRSERVETTIAKAKELRPLADRLITLGKRDTLHARRRAFSILSDKSSTDKLFSGLALRFAQRPGGYTRIVRTGYRAGDGSEMAIIEYLPQEEQKPDKKKGRKKKAAPKPTASAKKAPARKKAEPEEPEKRSRKPADKKKTAGTSRTAKQDAEGKEKPAAKPRAKKKTKTAPKDTP